MRFLCDAMLAKLARWLRIFGYDAELASKTDSDQQILARAKLEDRVVLTRDKTLAALGAALVPSTDQAVQVRFVMDKFGVKISEKPVPRFCSKCNGRLESTKHLPKYVKKGWKCVDCGQVYWEGAHWRGIKKFVARVKGLFQKH